MGSLERRGRHGWRRFDESISLLEQLGSLEAAASSTREIRATLQRELDDVEAQMRALASPTSASGAGADAGRRAGRSRRIAPNDTSRFAPSHTIQRTPRQQVPHVILFLSVSGRDGGLSSKF